MIELGLLYSIINILLALVLITGAFIVTRRDLMSLVNTYSMQSLLLALIAVALYLIHESQMLLYLAALTVISKVIVIPHALRWVQGRMSIKRDLEFSYMSSAESMLATLGMTLIVYYSFSRYFHGLGLNSLFYLGSVLGLSLALMGMIVTFTRRKVITKTIGYLTMENGVLLSGIFLAELPMIIEVLIIIDLMMLVLLAAIHAVGIDSSIEDFQAKMRPKNDAMKEDD